MVKTCDTCVHLSKLPCVEPCYTCLKRGWDMSAYEPIKESLLVIGLSGHARVGKDTVAEAIIEKTGMTRYAFADPFKAALKDTFGWTEDHVNGDLKDVDDPYYGFSPRRALQLFGTEFGRRLNPDVWIKVAERKIAALGGRVVIPDVRFENEAQFVREHGFLIHITSNREGIPKIAQHVSENGVSKLPGELWLINNGTITDMKNCITRMLEHKGIFS